MERFYFEHQIKEGERISDPEIIHKIKNVLRLRSGDLICAFDISGAEYTATLRIEKDSLILEKLEQNSTDTEPGFELILYPALIKKSRFEWLIEKCTEIGVSKFVPIISERTEVRSEKADPRWKRIAIEAGQQSGRTKIPQIEAPQKLEKALNSIGEGQILVAAERQGSDNPAEKIQAASTKKLHLFIGPEGGWSDADLALFKPHQTMTISLGERILRAETAAVVFTAFCIYLKKG